jgi:hypothetical protein
MIMMHQPVENMAYCLTCTNEWPVLLWASKEHTLMCPECRWRLGVPKDFVSSGWWAVGEHDAGEVNSVEADRQGVREKAYRTKKRDREREEFARDMRKDLERLAIIDPCSSRVASRARKVKNREEE